MSSSLSIFIMKPIKKYNRKPNVFSEGTAD